ncbi:hypothetical protein [Acetobacter estunensis]|uniref:flagellar biosynthesis protein FlhF n=1 Tax=Acetobacter estunensis TaxID=104097 RepID=UPI001C2CD584|nr:hypothetical protein [Acetobacter estunensis]MBV1835607.1 hypothetical protein [Acetobacter estunensis]MBV1836132.1 hypothetical protein [Acetobacter estunensis]
MKLRTFTGPSIQDAVRQVRAALGEAALILSERVTPTGVELIAAADPSNAQQTVPPQKASSSIVERPLTEGMFDRETLVWHRIPDVLIDELLADPCSVALSRLVRFGSFSFAPGKSPLALVGPAGSGKTLSVARLASRLVLSGITPLVITTDREKGGGIEQLAVHTRRLGIPLIAAHDTRTLKRALSQRQNGQPVLIDTAAVDPYDPETHAVLLELVAATRAQLCLTLPAAHDTEETADIAEVFCKANTHMMIATRLDQARRIGNILTAAACGLVLTEAGISDAVAGGLVRLTPQRLAQRLSCRLAFPDNSTGSTSDNATPVSIETSLASSSSSRPPSPVQKLTSVTHPPRTDTFPSFATTIARANVAESKAMPVT